MKKTKIVTYIDPATGGRVSKKIDVPPPIKVTHLPCGASVEEIPSMEALTALWSQGILSDLTTPLTHHSRQILAAELKKALTGIDEGRAIDALAATWQVPDDIALKVVSRLADGVQRQRAKREKNVNKAVQLKHENVLLQEQVKRLTTENTTLHADVKAVVNERDALKRGGLGRANKEGLEARNALHQSQDDLRCAQVKLAQTEAALTQAINNGAAVVAERNALASNAQQNLELALNNYESEVVGKLASVAEDHNKKAAEVTALNAVVSKLQDEKNFLCAQVDHEKQVNRNHSTDMANIIAKVKKESEVNENENNVTVEETLRSGDQVYCKVSGEGPFVLMTQVDEAVVEYSNPISNRKNSFNCGKLPIYNAWLVRCKDATMRTLPAPALTKERPKSSMSFGGVKALVTSDVTSKMFQAAIWISMLTMLYMRG